VLWVAAGEGSEERLVWARANARAREWKEWSGNEETLALAAIWKESRQYRQDNLDAAGWWQFRTTFLFYRSSCMWPVTMWAGMQNYQECAA
jgi:hypothetical protein